MNTSVGGGRKTVPKPGIDLPEITDGAKLQQLMKFYNLLGHGAMYEGNHNVFLVPENTWILFVTRASVPADKRKSGVLREVLDNFYFLREGETINQWNQRMYEGMRDGTLFQDILYKNDATDKFSIYEPGDLIQDLTLQFHNTSWPFMRLGIWTCPMNTTVKDYLNIINNGVEIAQYNDELKKIITVTLPSLATEKPAIATAIPKMIDYIINFNKITMESDEIFLNEADVSAALNDKSVSKVFYNAIHILQSSAQYGQGINRQYEFFDKPENLIKESPSSMKIERNSSGRVTKLYESTLYTLLNERKFVHRKGQTTTQDPPISMQPLLDTPKYRFIVVDACRSIEEFGKPQGLYVKREALTRRLSISARSEMCVNSLIELTRKRFAELVSGKTISPTSAIAKLLAGENVALPEFEASLVSAPNEELRNVLERPFKRNDKVFFLDDYSSEMTGRIRNVILNESGKLFYIIKLPSNQEVRVSAGKVYKNETNFISSYTQKVLEAEAREEAEDIEAVKQSETIGKRIQEKVEEKRLAKQKSEWDIRYFDLIKQYYSNFAKGYTPGLDIYTRVEKKGIPKNESVRINSYGVSPQGVPGYIASRGTTKRFYGLLNVNSSEERVRLLDLKGKLPADKRFEKGQLVVISGMTGATSLSLNGKVGVIVNIETVKPTAGGPEATIYRVQVLETGSDGTPAFKVYGIKPERLSNAVEGSTIGVLPPAALVTDYTKLVLSPEQEAAILAEAITEVSGSPKPNEFANEGGSRRRKKTRRLRKGKRQTKRRASKHK
jgi:hypothetical protein